MVNHEGSNLFLVNTFRKIVSPWLLKEADFVEGSELLRSFGLCVFINS